MDAIEEEFRFCIDILKEADKYGLIPEVVWSAFKHKEECPTASFIECMHVGAMEWDI